MTPARLVALRVLGRVTDHGAYADRALSAETTRAGLDPREARLASFLAAGAITHRRTIDHVVTTLAGRDPSRLQHLVRDAIRLGAFQLLFSGVAAHAAVDTSVELVAARAPHARGLVNALLRRVAADGAALVEALPNDTTAAAALRYSYPDWIAEAWFAAYGAEAARALLAHGNQPPSSALRLAPGAFDRVRAELDQAGVAFHTDPAVPSALILDDAFDTAASAMFAQGDATPMSASAQRIVPFLAPAPGERILDACAAPGGKAGHIISLVGSSADLTCVERDPRRARVLRENLDRVGAADARIVVADAESLPDELGRFDAILLDAPCSGLGVINSRPDLRWRRQPADIPVLAALQQQLIDALAARLAPRGRLVYSVCTLLPAENEQQVTARTVRRQLRTWPPDGDDAGFYAALIEP